jgi:universal stress protein A
MKPAFATIVVPTDFSEHADQALRYAETLAADPDVSLHLLHVVDMPIVPLLWSADMYVPDMAPNDLSAIKDAEHRLEQRRAGLAERGINASATVVLGTIPRAVSEYASEINADLVVMSTHGRTGMSHLAMGSVAEQVVRAAPCPVLTIRPRPGSLRRRSAA